MAARGHKEDGVIVGGVGGAVAGGAIAGANEHPCPDGYAYGSPPPPVGGFWAGAPQGLRERIDFMQDRSTAPPRAAGYRRLRSTARATR